MKKKLAQVFEELQKDNFRKELSPITIRNYATYLSSFINWCDEKGIKNPAKIDDEIIEDFKESLRLRKIENETVNSYLKAIRRFLHFAEAQSYIKSVPTIKLMRLLDKSKPSFAMEEVEKIFKNSDLSIPSVMTILYLGTGVRSRTMINLKVFDVDLNDRLLRCRITKNRKALILPLTASLAELLAAYIKFHNKRPNDWLFVNSFGGQFLRNSMYRTLNKFYERCGVSRTGVHILRHTFGKLMARNRCDAFTLQHWFGHHSIDESQNYVKMFANDLASSVELVNPTAGQKFI